QAEGIVVFCLYTRQTFAPQASLHARGLAPLVNVDEDPFTGSMQAGLLESARRCGILAAEDIWVEQGHFIGRPGSARVWRDAATGQVLVAGGAVPVFSTEFSFR